MKRKIKCSVCGTRFAPSIYQVVEASGIVQAINGGAKIYDACDCPECGRQKLLGERYERIAQQDEIVLDIDDGEEADDE